ncbi:heparan-alpha-glucosaminide N-acetyltransferase domain-containing protein [Arachnia propionica]|uniref:DUF1624 domain-containing protein n=1 Tax=Arachnia propionica TaxID=1750 RepID=A0A3P1WRS1_9ACTN|nr:heparan-alpha-glucosaminide N-acetyltransferase domain-containing protein [Arachnia propionica]RRD48548.1 DUF1624 domain-containing protein [Arachnia propionica]
MSDTAVDPTPTVTLRPARPWWPRLRDARRPLPRVLGVDAARGLAVVGMIVAHSVTDRAFGEDPAGLLGFSHGRSSILFATVAGVALAIMSGGSRPPEGEELLRVRLRLLGRAIALMGFAAILSLIPTPISVILASYAFWFVLALPALTWRPRTLLIVAACHALFGQLLTVMTSTWFVEWGRPYANGTSFVPEMLASSVFPAFVWMSFVLAGMALGRYGLDNIASLRVFLATGLVMFIAFAAPFLIEARSLAPLFGQGEKGFPTPSVSSNVLPSDFPTDPLCLTEDNTQLVPCTQEESEQQLKTMTPEQWEALDTLINQKLGIDPSEGSGSWDPGSMPGGSGSSDGKIIDLSQPINWKAVLWTLTPHSGSPFEVLSSGGLALATIAGLVLLGRVRWSRFVLFPLIGIGSMALTAYMAHVLVIQSLRDHVLDLHLALGLSLGLIILCALWKQVFTSGPLEQMTGALADRLAGHPKR